MPERTVRATESGATPAARKVDEQPTSAIIRSKVQSPVVRASTLERRRLLGWLERHIAERVCFVSAEAGYGKTTLLADYARRSRSITLWYRLETSDRDWSTFLGYLVAAVREAVPEFGSSTTNLLAQVAAMGPTLDVAVGTLLAELNELQGRHILLILDDFHLVQESQDVQAILERMFELAPEDMAFVLAGRRSPERRLARLEARGQVATLTTDDLRFSRRETEELFSLGYGMALDDDIIGVIDARTEGWVASLQLVYSSIRSSAPHEVREFVRDLSGTSKPLYDFLAEEVLGRQTPQMQRILIHASLLVRISADLVLAALSVTVDPPAADQVADSLEAADEQGLMSRSAAGSTTRRFHPLLREFLHRQLVSHTPADLVCQMHLRIAVTAEPTDWLTAAHHYVEGGAPREAMRVLSESTMRTLGTGAWGAAIELVDRMPEIEPPLAVQVIRARALVAAGKPAEAVALLERLVRPDCTPIELSLVRVTRLNACFRLSQPDQVTATLTEIINDPASPNNVLGIAEGYSLLLHAAAGGPLAPTKDGLVRLATQQIAEGLHHFAGISLHNAAHTALSMGDYRVAIALAETSLAQFSKVLGPAPDAGSTRAIIALCAMELGESRRAFEEFALAVATPNATSDVFGDYAFVSAAIGDAQSARMYLASAERAERTGNGGLGTQGAIGYAKVMTYLGNGDHLAAATSLDAITTKATAEVDHVTRRLAMAAVLAGVQSSPAASEIAESGVRAAQHQGAKRWEPRFRILGAVASRDPVELQLALTEADSEAQLALPELADVIASALTLLSPLPSEVQRSIATWPARWLPVLRRLVREGNTPEARSAAHALSEYGTLDDVPLIVAWEQTYVRNSSERTMWMRLARRTSPTLAIHDLGRSGYSVGPREIRLKQTRRKAAALLMYLASRSKQTATREQVLEELWPEQSPSGATNSLHQTLYFLRRTIDPWYEDNQAVDYLAMDSDIVYLDQDLVHVDSVSFQRQATEAIARADLALEGATILQAYGGRFAPEFAYEDWAMAWGDRVHATYLQLAEMTASALVESGQLTQAADVLSATIVTDPEAHEIESALIYTLWKVGARAAAVEQYSHYAAAYERDLGTNPPSFDEVVGGPVR